MVGQQGSERVGEVLREAINTQLRIRGRPSLDKSTLPLRGSRRLRRQVLVEAGHRVKELGRARGSECLERVGKSVARTGGRVMTARRRTPRW